jgi:predicted DNA-binding helix-hairpin-helix protein
LDIDPKLAWALRNRHTFPIDINRSPLEMLYRIPGLGVRNAQRIVRLRRHHAVSLEDLIKLRVNLKKTMPFMICANHHPARLELSSSELRAKFAPPPKQMEMDFSAAPALPRIEKNMLKQAGAEALHGEF